MEPLRHHSSSSSSTQQQLDPTLREPRRKTRPRSSAASAHHSRRQPLQRRRLGTVTASSSSVSTATSTFTGHEKRRLVLLMSFLLPVGVVQPWSSHGMIVRRATHRTSTAPWKMAMDSRELRFYQKQKSPPLLSSSSSSSSGSNRFLDDGRRRPPSNTSTSTNRLLDELSHAYSFVLDGAMNHAQGHPVLTAMSSLARWNQHQLEATASSAAAVATTNEASSSVYRRSFTTYTTTNSKNNSNKFATRNQEEKDDRAAAAFTPPPKTTPVTDTAQASSFASSSEQQHQKPPQSGYGPSIQLTPEEHDLFELLRRVQIETGLHTTLRVAGGWVRDKLLATPEFQAYHKVFDVGNNNNQNNGNTANSPTTTARLTSKFRTSNPVSMGRQGTKVLVNSGTGGNNNIQQPVDIDIALDDMLGREFADRLNEYLTSRGEAQVTVGMVLKNPEKSKHLETATMKVGSFWIDFVNLRAEEYTQDSRIPDLMRIGTPSEDSFRRDLTINALFYNINTGEVEDWTGRGFADLRKGIVTTPLPPLTTLLDDPLRVLRSIRFAARLRFTMDPDLRDAAKTESVRHSLSQKVSRERVGGELDLMLRSPDPVGAVRLLTNLHLVDCVFPIKPYVRSVVERPWAVGGVVVDEAILNRAVAHMTTKVFARGVDLLSTAHDHLADCRWSPPVWCVHKKSVFGTAERNLVDDQEARRLLWYASFLKPLYDDFAQLKQPEPTTAATTTAHTNKLQKGRRKKSKRSIVALLLVDELKRPGRDADSIERIIKAADDFSSLLNTGFDVSATMILLSDVHVKYATPTVNGNEVCCDPETVMDCGDDGSSQHGRLLCSMNGRAVDSRTEDDPLWEHAMEFRLLCSKVLQRVGPLWRPALFLAISEELVKVDCAGIDYPIEGDLFDESQAEVRRGVLERFDAFAAALQQIGLIGIWNEKPVADGETIQTILPGLPKGPAFREVMVEQTNWMATHPGAGVDALGEHLRNHFVEYAAEPQTSDERSGKKR